MHSHTPAPLIEAETTCYDSRDDPPAEDNPEGQRSSVPDALPLSGTDTDWREFRARLIRSQAASTSGRAAEDQVPCIDLSLPTSPMHALIYCTEDLPACKRHSSSTMEGIGGGLGQEQRHGRARS
jgi:hypothetical protein